MPKKTKTAPVKQDICDMKRCIRNNIVLILFVFIVSIAVAWFFIWQRCILDKGVNKNNAKTTEIRLQRDAEQRGLR